MVYYSAFATALVVIFFGCNGGDATYYLQPRVFNVMDYGALADGRTDDSQAFLKAWNDGCQYFGKARVVIPGGTYMLYTVSFVGPCKGPMAFLIRGTIKAPAEPKLFFRDTWIGFRNVDGLIVAGGGFLDGQGAAAWPYNDCDTNPHCQPLPATLRLEYVTNSLIRYIHSINSKMAHISLFSCNNVDIGYVSLSAPENSRNTDGIQIGCSQNIKISRATIGTGDDCISMAAGSQDVNISQVVCGPGHGISIGSLGRGRIQDVKGINVMNSTFLNTQNGVRIKTLSPSPPSLAADINFQDIIMENVNNPIIIDEEYCPSCRRPIIGHSVSKVQIRNATFKNIWGTSRSKLAVSLDCSKLVPCQDVTLVDINLNYYGPGGPAASACFYAVGRSYGTQVPPSCL